MDTREFKRMPMRLPAHFKTQKCDRCACVVRDFCPSGMLIEFTGSDAFDANVNLSSMRHDEAVDISFQLRGKSYQLRSTLARVVSRTAFGVKFTSADRKIIQELQHAAESHSNSDEAEDEDERLITSFRNSNTEHVNQVDISPAKRSTIFKSLCHAMVEFIEEQFPNFIKQLRNAFHEALGKGLSGNEAQELQDTLANLNSSFDKIYSGLMKGIQHNFNLAIENKPLIDDVKKSAASDDLSLVGKNDFEEWLAVKVLITNADDWYRRELLELQLRLDCLSPTRNARQGNPIRPGVLCSLLHEQIARFNFSHKSLSVIYHVYGNTVLGNLDAFYRNVNEYLSKEGVLDDVNIMQYLTEKAVNNASSKGGKKNQSKQPPQGGGSRYGQGGGAGGGVSSGGFSDTEFEQSDWQNYHDDDDFLSDESFHPGDLGSSIQQSQFGHQLDAAEALANSALSQSQPFEGDYLSDPDQPGPGTNEPQRRPSVRREYMPRAPSKRPMNSSMVETERSLARRAAVVAQKLIQVQGVMAHNYEVMRPGGKGCAIDKRSLAELEQGQEEDENTFSSREVMQGLSILQIRQKTLKGGAENAHLIELLTKFMSELAGSEKSLPNHEKSAIEVIDKLFSIILETNNLSLSLIPYIIMLKIPFAKINILDDTLLSAEQHPAREVLNQIAQLGARGGAVKKETLNEVDRIVSYILENYDRDIFIFSEVVPELNDLLNAQDDIYKRNLNRVQETYAGQERMEVAKEEVNESVKTLFMTIAQGKHGLNVPEVMQEMMLAGWRELLILALIRQGAESTPWKMGLNVLKELYLRLAAPETLAQGKAGKARFNENELIQVISKGFAKATSNQQKYTKVMERIKLMLTGRMPESERKWITIDEMLLEANADSVINKLKSGKPKRTQSTIKTKWMDRVENLEIGDWINFSDNQRKEKRAQLAWVSRKKERLVFVNQQGVKLAEKQADELALDLQLGTIHIISGAELPIVDKCLDVMVQNIYKQVTFDATHDQLTGLLNRKEFERQVRICLMDAKQRSSKHTLCHVDLDQFKVINSNCGYEAGDRVLKDIADIVQKAMPDDGPVARLGGNTFGLLFKNLHEGEAYRLASKIVGLVQDYKFISAKTPYQLGASVGLLTVDEESGEAEELLQAVESACTTAKESGRNRINTYRPDDDEMKRRKDIMSWVAKLNRALDEDKLVLRIQPITELLPVNPDDAWIKRKEDTGLGRVGHCEVLLSVLGDNGETIPPLEFIRAAERYNRMQSVDRWVIRKIFSWVADNPKTIESMGGVSVNLSGHSINDEELMRFIFEEFKSTNIDPSLICFEITETVAVANINDAADFINEMKRLGCKFSLDDFGSGLSSYTYLKHLPVDYIKIDGAFVRDIVKDDMDFAMVRSIVEMGHLMGKQVIAEYVTSTEAVDRLRQIGVDYAQGFFVGVPKLISEVNDATLGSMDDPDELESA